MGARTRPIIAVFGGTENGTPEVAEALGYQLASMHCIVLTGGDGPGGIPVKNRTLAGVDRAALEEGLLAPWVGVDRGPYEDPRVTPRSIVLNLGYGHRRNYVETRLCDAAVCFVGEAGTASELVFCLAVGRPLVLIDYAQGPECPVENGKTLEDFRLLSQTRVPRPVELDSPIDRCIAEAYDRLGADLPAHRHASSEGPSAARHIAETALELASTLPFRGSFPEWPTDTAVRQVYQGWLASLSP